MYNCKKNRNLNTSSFSMKSFLYSKIATNTRRFKLLKGKGLRKHSLHEKTAASVLMKLFLKHIFTETNCLLSVFQ